MNASNWSGSDAKLNSLTVEPTMNRSKRPFATLDAGRCFRKSTTIPYQLQAIVALQQDLFAAVCFIDEQVPMQTYSVSVFSCSSHIWSPCNWSAGCQHNRRDAPSSHFLLRCICLLPRCVRRLVAPSVGSWQRSNRSAIEGNPDSLPMALICRV